MSEISQQYAQELARQVDELEAENEQLRADCLKLQDVLAADFQEMSRLRAENGRLRAVLSTNGWLSDRGDIEQKLPEPK